MANKDILFTIDENYINKYNLDNSYLNKKIVIYHDRYTHIDKHRLEFSSINEYQNIVNNIGNIVSNPDFIVIDNTKKGINIIKKINDTVLIAIRISNSNELKIKTLYPINETKRNKLYKNKTK